MRENQIKTNSTEIKVLTFNKNTEIRSLYFSFTLTIEEVASRRRETREYCDLRLWKWDSEGMWSDSEAKSSEIVSVWSCSWDLELLSGFSRSKSSISSSSSLRIRIFFSLISAETIVLYIARSLSLLYVFIAVQMTKMPSLSWEMLRTSLSRVECTGHEKIFYRQVLGWLSSREKLKLIYP